MSCTCGGIAPGYPMHEDGCGQPERQRKDDPFCNCGWFYENGVERVWISHNCPVHVIKDNS